MVSYRVKIVWVDSASAEQEQKSFPDKINFSCPSGHVRAEED